MDGQLMSPKQVAARLGVTRDTVIRWSNDPSVRFPIPIRINRRVIRWRPAQIVAFEQRHTHKSTPRTERENGETSRKINHLGKQ